MTADFARSNAANSPSAGRRPLRGVLFCCAALLCIATGCDGPPYGVAPVEGRITLDGEPLVHARITLQPVGEIRDDPVLGRGSVGETDMNGRYTLRQVDSDRSGALVCRHRVVITTAAPRAQGEIGLGNPLDGAGRPAAAEERVPERYRDGSQIYKVPKGGTTEANFDLTTEVEEEP